jgi:hypothetical protein
MPTEQGVAQMHAAPLECIDEERLAAFINRGLPHGSGAGLLLLMSGKHQFRSDATKLAALGSTVCRTHDFLAVC